MSDETEKNVKTELSDVRVLEFGTNKQGDVITKEGGTVPNEVAVVGDMVAGRATLRVKDDGIYASIVLNKGSVEGRTPSALVTVHTSEAIPPQGRKITRYEIKGVGLDRVVKALATPATESKENEGNDEF